jgi:glycerate 2-kinase
MGDRPVGPDVTGSGRMATVIIAPDGFGGTLTAADAAAAIAAGWRDVRPDDELVLVPMSDGGEGLLDVLEVLATPSATRQVAEVAGPLGQPVDAGWLLRSDGSAVVESAQACGLALVAPERRDPMLATTYGVGELLEVIRELGARRILVGLGGTASVDGGAGALTALGFRPTLEDGSGLKIGGEDLHRVARVTDDWVADWRGITIELLADVTTPLTEAARIFGPQKGASPDQVRHLAAGLEQWAEVVERDLVGAAHRRGVVASTGAGLRHRPSTGAAGGLGYALVAGLGATMRTGSVAVGELVGLPEAVARADVVVTGEGRLDATTGTGKVVTHVAALARERRVAVHGVVGQLGPGAPQLDRVEVAAPEGPSADPFADVTAAARRLASH